MSVTTTPASALAEAPLAAVPLPYGMSERYTDVLVAILTVQKGLFSPFRNKEVDYINKKNQRIRFRYTTLAALNEMLREPLCEAGLIIAHFSKPLSGGATILVSRVIHAQSGQYLECAQHLRVSEEAGMQAQGSALTYARRYAICSMLNLAADEDDDANAAEGNTINHPAPEDEKRALRERFNTLVHRANATKPDITGIFDGWLADLESWLALRDDADNARWRLLEAKIHDALLRVHGPHPAAAWRASFLTQSNEDVEMLRGRWEQEWQPGLSKMKAADVRAFNQLGNHMRAMGTRIMLRTQEAQDVKAAEAAEAELAAKPDLQLTSEEADFVEGPYLRDDLGEIASDRIGSREEFATMYVAMHRGADDPDALERHNLAALDWARGSVEAKAILAAIGARIVVAGPEPQPVVETAPASGSVEKGPAQQQAENPAYVAADMAGVDREEVRELAAFLEEPVPADEPEDEPVRELTYESIPEPAQLALLPQAADAMLVQMPTRARGTPDFSGYLLRVKSSLSGVGAEQLEAWCAVNAPVFDRMPAGTRMQCVAQVETRKMVLGIRGGL